MKRLIKFFSVCCLIALSCFMLLGCRENITEAINHYSLNLIFDEENSCLEGQEQVVYVNNSDNAFEKLYFHLYPNAFRQEAKISPVSTSKQQEAYYLGDSYGGIEILNVLVWDKQVEFSICGEDENILEVALQEILYPDENVEINISFVVTMPKINHRMGIGENTINFGNFYPIACVYEEGKGFSQNLYHSNGDPFYSDCSNYDVKLQYSSFFSLASSGVIENTNEKDGRKTSEISAKNVRDFCFVLSGKFETVSSLVGQVAVTYYGYQGDEDLNQNLRIASDALETFNSLFGQYPYNTLNIVKSNFLHGGMEYPNLVLISDKVQKEDFGYVIVHEIAHQWWYGVVGNDQYNHAWLDEALAEYSTLLFYKNNSSYGENFDKMLVNAEKSYRLFVKVYTKVNGNVDTSMERALNQFKTEPEYVECTYTKGVLLMDGIRQSVGDKKFVKALANYYEKFKFKNSCPADFISLVNKTCKTDLESYINSWLYGKIVM